MINDLPFDPNRVAELMDEYKNARTRRDRRKIETEVLEQTVWTVRTDLEEIGFAAFSRESFEQICEHVETDDEEVKLLLRRPYVKL